MSFFTQGRNTLRAAVVVTAAATCLVGAASANASLDGAPKANFTNRPNLKSVTLSAGINVTNATFTFDKPVTVTNPNGFSVTGYDTGDALPGTSPAQNGASVTVRITGAPDPNEVTTGTVLANAVNSTTAGSGLNSPNIADSVPVTGALGEPGTRGHTVGPDLVSVRNSGSNTLTYVFDEELKTATAAGFTVVNTAGDRVLAQSATPSGNEAIVTFPSGTNVNGSRQASEDETAATNAFDEVSSEGNADIAGQSNTTNAPVLVSAEFISANQVRYTFKETVTSAGSIPSGFGVNISDATTKRAAVVGGAAGTAIVVTGNSAVVTFPASFDLYREFLVRAFVDAGAIQSQNGTINPDSGKPVGGNAGAKATGYTTAPDGVAATFSGVNANLTVDARLSTAPDATKFTLYDRQGDAGPNAVTANATINGAPGPTAVTVTFNSPASVAEAGGIQLMPGAVTGTGPTLGNQPNIVQTIGR